MEQPQATNLPVQIVLYTSQVELLAAACKYTLETDKRIQKHAYIENGLWDLVQFLDSVNEHPNYWAPTGRMARSLKVRVRRLKGPSQQPRPMGREARRKRRKEAARARRGK